MDARRQGLLLHVGAAGRATVHGRRAARASPSCASTSSAAIRRRIRWSTRRPATPQTFLGGGISRDGHWLIAAIQHGWNSSDIYFKRRAQAGRSGQTLVEGVDANFDVDDVARPLLRHDERRRAALPRVQGRSEASPQRAAWKEIVAESDATLEGDAGRRRAPRARRTCATRRARSRSTISTASSSASSSCRRSARAAASAATPTRTPATSRTRRSPSRRSSTRRRSRPARSSEWTRIKLPVDTSKLRRPSRCSIPSKDGTKISMFIIHSKGTQKDGTNPTILYGYGGFNVSDDAGVRRLARGVARARRRLRDPEPARRRRVRRGLAPAPGCCSKKQNVFDDFIAAAEYLIDGRLDVAGAPRDLGRLERRPARRRGDHAAARAVRRGGLRGAAARHAALPPVRLGQDLGPGVRLRRGSRRSSRRCTRTRRIASPSMPGRARIRRCCSTRADHDDRVDPMHARKLAAVLQADQTADAPILLAHRA